MSVEPERIRWRWCLAARIPGLTAAMLAGLTAESPALELLEYPRRERLAALGLSPSALAWLAAPDTARLVADLKWLDDSGCALLPAIAPEYPEILRQSPDAPAVLFVRGDVRVLAEPQLAMVGSRNP